MTGERQVARGFDAVAFRQWYDGERAGEIAGALEVSVLVGGRSNLTYAVTDGANTWVVRRPPLGHVQATAHDMAREYQVMSALADTAVPVPRMLAICSDTGVLGAPFFVMEHIKGTVYRSAAQLNALGADSTAALAGRMIDVLADLHAVDPAEVGLAQFGRPDGFLERQVRRWGTQLAGSRSRELAGAAELQHRLGEAVETVAPSASGIVHGDYRIGNLMFDGERLAAVVDWEMATLGDTRADLAMLLAYDRMATLGADVATDVALAQGYPSAESHLERYTARTGREPGDMDFHLALAHFKVAVILEGIHFRHLRGQTVGSGFDRIGSFVEPMLAAGLAALST